MKYAVFGAGGVGGYLGARLADAGHDVHLIARGDHLEALRTDGLCLESVAGDTTVDLPATDDPTDIGPCDYVLFCVKSYDTRDAAGDLEPLLEDGTAVVSFQNGVDNEQWLAEEIGDERVVGGVAYIFSTIGEPGVVEHTGGPARFVYGELDGRRTERIEALDDALTDCEGVDAVLADDVRVELWRKFAFICAQAGMTAATRLLVGEIRDVDASWEMYRRLLEEVCTVARAEGVDLPDGLVDEWLEFARELDPEMSSSLQYDLTHGKPMELDALHGSVVRHAADCGVDVPMNEAVHAILRPWADRNQ
ncbi:2-dehydropantoate 2-reductase [Haloterrigena turkmenica DSM 5511]|uniref:2-dehydropantoate 2-reductase n=1 Tax=Haloterrigena turkmenica (strain ATCC 51198 / DSM 5511 / JCM 9101 / NCIMB 13204 / VKM B-1734 / 4k) TaxID=543526 RepID=D2RWZ8_HALTV|nr:2-dehydropantoate 2-reductase [Haloterrigena turkmenica]ADB59610.1 2-dehydropantoate 2-reductase [Haloterrigena turkmenica DSM 5511]